MNRMTRWALCGVASSLIGFVGAFVIGRLLYSSESLFYGWLKWINVLNAIGLFEYAGVEGMENAVIDSLALVWIFISAWLAWRLNRFLQRRVSDSTGNIE